MAETLNQPTPTQIRNLRNAAGLTQAQAGEIVHVSSRAWQNWETEGKEGRQIPLAAWELFLIKTGQRFTQTLYRQLKMLQGNLDDPADLTLYLNHGGGMDLRIIWDDDRYLTHSMTEPMLIQAASLPTAKYFAEEANYHRKLHKNKTH
jgi:putative transcriptional regulator